jgi:hypothetical protein
MSAGDLNSFIINFQTKFSSGFSSSVGTGGIIRKSGKIVNLEMSSLITTTVIAGGKIVFSVPLPFVPEFGISQPIWVTSDGVDSVGNLNLDENGIITINLGSSSPFPGSKLCGYQAFSLTYSDL